MTPVNVVTTCIEWSDSWNCRVGKLITAKGKNFVFKFNNFAFTFLPELQLFLAL